MAFMASIRLGDLLIKAKVITDTQLKSALAEQAKWGGRLGEILVRMNTVTEDMLVKALSKQLNLPAVNLDSIESVPAHVRGKVSIDIARDLVALPLQLRDEGRTLVVAMAEPQNVKQLDTLRAISRCRIMPQVAGRQAIARAFTRFYDQDAQISEADESFKMVDAQGHTVIKAEPRAPPVVPARAPPALERPGVAALTKSPLDLLNAIEAAQRKEVAAIKAMVEMLIEKGVFTREEYLAKVKR
jgi:hypothetical protein